MANKKELWLSSLLVAIALGTAWAVRGKFGHEQGAAWAGGIGGLALVLAAKRNDWYTKVFQITLASAFGWGIGGMISYGVVVGYGRGSDFLNVYYGLAMLFVIGGLYGFTGGGLLGLALIDSDQIRIKWHRLLVEMIAFGILTYALVIGQLEWFMTPPRSEMWAACLGASLAVAWHVVRLRQWDVLRVAVWTSLGAGFGFAFGNVLQVLGSTLSVPLNLWNVMEYSIGFCGGLAMAYAIFTTKWPPSSKNLNRYSNVVPILLLMLFIPFVVWDQSFTTEKLNSLLSEGATTPWISVVKLISILAIVGMTWMVMHKDFQLMVRNVAYDFITLRNIFIIYLGVYTMLSFLVTGVFSHPIEQYLYIANIALFLFLVHQLKSIAADGHERPAIQLLVFILIMVILCISAFAMIHSHGPLKGSQVRFENKITS